jgi:uncharacterized protein (TIGR03435 family)
VPTPQIFVDNDERLRHNCAMRQKQLLRFAAVVMLPCGLFSQTPQTNLQKGSALEQLDFEVATVKPPDPQILGQVGARGGPGTSDPGRISYRMTLRRLLLLAHEITSEQLSGPDWLNDVSFDIVAKVPEGSTTAQVHVMLQHLLAERFSMTLHHELQDKPAYDLTVAKTGLKLTETAYPNAQPPAAGPVEFTLDKNDFPILPKDAAVQARVSWIKKDSIRSTFRAYSIAGLTQELAGVLAEAVPSEGMVSPRVIDKTGLTGLYDFTLEYASASDYATGPSIFGAVEKQLGLKLDKSKAPLDVIVIDRIAKTPTAN